MTEILILEKITKRELEIVRLVCAGLTSKQIGERLYLSQKTVDTHRANIYSKLHVHTALELYKYCLNHNVFNGEQL